MAVLKELQADLREQGHGEHVVDGVVGKLNILLLCLALHVGFQLRQLRLQQVRRTAGDGLCSVQHACL